MMSIQKQMIYVHHPQSIYPQKTFQRPRKTPKTTPRKQIRQTSNTPKHSDYLGVFLYKQVHLCPPQHKQIQRVIAGKDYNVHRTHLSSYTEEDRQAMTSHDHSQSSQKTSIKEPKTRQV
jgi:hypothetical protein